MLTGSAKRRANGDSPESEISEDNLHFASFGKRENSILGWSWYHFSWGHFERPGMWRIFDITVQNNTRHTEQRTFFLDDVLGRPGKKRYIIQCRLNYNINCYSVMRDDLCVHLVHCFLHIFGIRFGEFVRTNFRILGIPIVFRFPSGKFFLSILTFSAFAKFVPVLNTFCFLQIW